MDLIRAQRAVFESGLGPNEKLVALALLDHQSNSCPKPWPGLARLAQWTGLKKRALVGIVQRLEKLGIVGVKRESGKSNVYDLGRLTSENLPVHQMHRCTKDTSARAAPVHELHLTGAADAPPPVHQMHPKDPSEGTQEGTQFAADAADPPSGKKPKRAAKTKSKPAKQEPERTEAQRKAYTKVVDAYFVAFERRTKAKPPFGAREGKAIWDLLDKLKCDGARAVRIVQRAHESDFGGTTSIVAIATDPAKYEGLRSVKPNGRARAWEPQPSGGQEFKGDDTDWLDS